MVDYVSLSDLHNEAMDAATQTQRLMVQTAANAGWRVTRINYWPTPLHLRLKHGPEWVSIRFEHPKSDALAWAGPDGVFVRVKKLTPPWHTPARRTSTQRNPEKPRRLAISSY